MAGNRGPRISQEVMSLIIGRALRSNIKRTALAEELEREIQGRGWHSPTIETMEKLISKIRNHKEERDKPWSMGSLTIYELPPAFLPVIVGIVEEAQKEEKPLTIREVQWAARLWLFIKDILTLKLTKSSLLLWWARTYAGSERLSEFSHKNLETFEEDKMLSKYPEEFAVDAFLWRSVVKEKGEDFARAFFRYSLLLERDENSPALVDEQLGNELLEIEKYLGENKLEKWAEIHKSIAARQEKEVRELYAQALASGDKEPDPFNLLEKTQKSSRYFEGLLKRFKGK